MAGLDLTSFAPALKTLYPPDKIEKMIYSDRPMLAMLPKDEQFFGDSSKETLMYGNPQNISATFATAQGLSSSSVYKAFTLTRVKKYGFGFVDNETMKASMNDKGAFLKALSEEIDNATDGVAQAIAIDVARDGSGALGARASISSDTVTLSNPEDSRNFEVGMSVSAAAAKSSGSLRTGTTTVTAVDSVLGKITLASAAAISSFADNDYLFRTGDRNACISGFQGWIPYDDRSTLLAASYFGVVRSANPSRLAGLATDLSALPIEQAVSRAVTLVEAEGGRPDYAFLNFEDFEDLRNALGAKVMYNEVVTSASQTKYGTVGFSGIKIHGSNGMVTVLADRTVVPGRMYLMTSKSWKLRSLGPIVDLFDTDGVPFLRQASADGVEIRLTSYANLVCRAPAYNGQFKLR
jgi:hypothetical protein